MKKILLAFLTLLIITYSYSQKSMNNSVSIIPEPVSVQPSAGNYILPAKPVILYSDDSLSFTSHLFAEQLQNATGYNIIIKKSKLAQPGAIQLSLNHAAAIPFEGYKLVAKKSGINITASSAAGIFYGVQTLLQLFPEQVESKTKVTLTEGWKVPAGTIEDHPRFGWRGLMFDVSRHFFTKDQVKEYIDQMVKYKYNLLHLHLTDDEGWRIEIKSLPKLTSVGAWRVNKTGTFGDFDPPAPDEPRTYGGFFTQDDIRDIIQYAKDRFVNILPEVDVPGHSLAAIASYPELSCTPGAENYKVRSGEKIMEWPANGHFYGLVDNTLCPANEKVYDFLDKVFTEIAQLFPFEYIHVGGDECARNFWEKSDAIKALMQKENLKNLDEVQSYFEKRVEKIVESKGKKIIGWDEILEGGLAPNAAVMSWRGMNGGIAAAKMNHEVVMSPTDFVYLDYMQGDGIMEPPVYASLRLNKVYQFEPVPDGVDPKFIKGGQANLWTEQVYNMRHAEYMIWPRAFAVAEVLWSPKEKRNWNDFIQRVETQFKRYDVAEVKYAPSMYDPVFTESKNAAGELVVDLTTEINGLDIYYSFDNSFPDQFYPKATGPIVVPKDASTLKVITYRNGKPIGRMMVMPVDELKKRAGIKK
ncbi:MAG: family 20 glycosylhydrolase [Bacteroidetes bacterium]|nr:family 20 glycosylhydrolase [Bacteroidota bacterium]